MADVNFKDFSYDPVSVENYIVGYNPTANFEIRTKISDVVNTSVTAISGKALTKDDSGVFTVFNNSLSSNGVDTFLKIKNIDSGITYGLKLQVVG
jgi:hypothetical protein